VKIGDLIELDSSARKNSRYAGKLGLIVDVDDWSGYFINIEGEVKKFHTSQIARIVNESR
jgi:hypothetical protein